MSFDKKKYTDDWENYYNNLKESFLFPNEYVLRTFLGKYPGLDIRQDYTNLKICDLSCGDGRNLVGLNKMGFDLYATEINDKICAITQAKLLNHVDAISVDIRAGFNWDIPFEAEFFDYLLSWNACYYMENEHSDFKSHVDEFSRVLKKDAYFVASIPMEDCCTLLGAQDLDNGLIKIQTKTKFSYLNNAIFKKFTSLNDIKNNFGHAFKNFRIATLRDDCYGLALNYYILVCEKK